MRLPSNMSLVLPGPKTLSRSCGTDATLKNGHCADQLVKQVSTPTGILHTINSSKASSLVNSQVAKAVHIRHLPQGLLGQMQVVVGLDWYQLLSLLALKQPL